MVFCFCGKVDTGDSDIRPLANEKTGKCSKPARQGAFGGIHHTDFNESMASPTSKPLQKNESIMNETTTPGTSNESTRELGTSCLLVPRGEYCTEECSDVNGYLSMIPFTPSSEFPKDLISADPSYMGDQPHPNPNLSSDDPLYIDEFGLTPEDQYNTAADVPFFSICSSTMGYPTARLLQFRLSGIISIPDSPPLRAPLDSGL
jgi:hypothetical protein